MAPNHGWQGARLAGVLLLGVLTGCSGAAPPGAALGPLPNPLAAAGDDRVLELTSRPVSSGDSPILVEWRQAVSGAGLDVYLYGPGGGDTCHLSASGTITFHCANHADTISIGAIDTSQPHTVSINLLRGDGATRFTVRQDGESAPRGRDRVSGTPPVPAGGRVHLQVVLRGGTTAEIENVRVREAE